MWTTFTKHAVHTCAYTCYRKKTNEQATNECSVLCVHVNPFHSISSNNKIATFHTSTAKKVCFRIFSGYYRNSIKLKPFANGNNDRKYCWNISRYRFTRKKVGYTVHKHIECMRQHENLCVSLKAMKCIYIFSADSHRFINQSVRLRNDESISVHFECSPHQADSVIIYLLFFSLLLASVFNRTDFFLSINLSYSGCSEHFFSETLPT